MNKKFLAGVISLSLICAGAVGYVVMPTGKVIDGVYVDDVNVSGLTKDELIKVLQKKALKGSSKVTLTDGTKQVEVPLEELGIEPRILGAAEEIMAHGYEKDFMTYVQHRLSSLITPKHFSLKYDLNGPKAEGYLIAYGKTIDSSGKDASLTVEGGEIVRHKAEIGRRLDVKKTFDALKQQLDQGMVDRVNLVIDNQAQPTISDKDLESITVVLGHYQTHFDAGNTSRTHNIFLASEKVNGVLLSPNQVFSFNQIVGERTAEAGYDDAPVFIGGKLVPGIGGGICQVSSTLFNTALLSGMSIVERDTHFSPVGYIPAGRDATVAYGYIDFQFRNSYGNPVYVVSQMNGGTLDIYILGHTNDKPQSVYITVGGEEVIPHNTIKKEDLSLEDDVVETGHDGLTMTTTREIITASGQSIVDSFPSRYEPLDTIIIKGSKSKEKEEKEKLEKEKADREKAKQSESKEESATPNTEKKETPAAGEQDKKDS